MCVKAPSPQCICPPQVVTCSPSKVATAPGDWCLSGFGSNHMVALASVSCFCHLIPVTCCSMSKHPLCPRLPLLLLYLFVLSPFLTLFSLPGVDANMNYLYNARKLFCYWESIDKFSLALLTYSGLGVVAASLSLQTQYMQPVKCRKCLSLNGNCGAVSQHVVSSVSTCVSL